MVCVLVGDTTVRSSDCRAYPQVGPDAARNAGETFSAYLQQKGLDARKKVVYCYGHQENVDGQPQASRSDGPSCHRLNMRGDNSMQENAEERKMEEIRTLLRELGRWPDD
jgi:hypothetical protein